MIQGYQSTGGLRSIADRTNEGQWDHFAKHLAKGHDPRSYERVARLDDLSKIFRGDDLLVVDERDIKIYETVRRVSLEEYRGRLWKPDRQVLRGVEMVPQGEKLFTIDPSKEWYRFHRQLL